MSAPARKLAVADLKSVCTTDEEWEDTYRMVVAAGGKPGGAQALLALAGKAGVADRPKKAPGLKAAVGVHKRPHLVRGFLAEAAARRWRTEAARRSSASAVDVQSRQGSVTLMP